MKTIAVPESLHKEILSLKLEENEKNAAKFIEKLLIEYRKQKFLGASEKFRKAVKKRKISFAELLKKSETLRGEISDEWF